MSTATGTIRCARIFKSHTEADKLNREHKNESGCMDGIKDFAGWFSEKGSQIEPSCMVAFGIKIQSRYGKAYEIIEMIQFATRAAEFGVASYIDSVFFDSKSCGRTIYLKAFAQRQCDALDIIDECAEVAFDGYWEVEFMS